MPADFQVVYRDFSKGHFGKIGLFNAPEGSFEAKNLMRTQGGIVLPRPGTEAYVTTGLPNGEVHAIGWNGVPGRDLWVLVNQTVYQRDSSSLSATWTAVTGTITAEPNEACPWVEVSPGITYILAPGQGLWKLDLATGAPGTLTKVTAVTADMAGRCIAQWGERLFIGGWANPANRVYFSDPQSFSTWPAANFFNIGPAPQPRVMYAQRQHLAIALQDGSWYVMTGSSPTTGTLRSVLGPQATWHFWTNSATRTPDDMIWMVPTQGTWPAAFDGQQVAELRHLEYAPIQGNIAGEQNVVNLKQRDEVGFISGEPTSRGQSILLQNGTWTYHEIAGGSLGIAGGVASDGQTFIFLHNFGGPGVPPNVYRMDVSSPAVPGGVIRTRGDASSSTPLDAYLYLPGFFVEDGQEVRVRQIIVDGWKWNIGGGATNTLDAAVHVYAQSRTDAPRVESLDAWTEPTSSASVNGARHRWIWNVGAQGWGAGFQVRLTTLIGVGVEQVVVKLERSASRPRA